MNQLLLFWFSILKRLSGYEHGGSKAGQGTGPLV